MSITHAATGGPIQQSQWNAPHVGGFDVYNVKAPAYGAVGNDTADDQPAIQAAIDDAGAAGGGIVFIPKGTYRLTSLEIASLAHLWNPYSNVSIVGIGDASVLKATDAYSILYQGPQTKFTDPTAYTINGPVAKGATSVTTTTASQAGNFAAGDYVYIRTGQTVGAPGSGFVTQPDSEINRVVTASAGTGVITLAWPTVKPYAQEYFQGGTTSGETTTSVTANLAILGIAKINSYLIHDQVYRNLRFEHTNTGDTAYGMIGGHILRCLIENVSWKGKAGFQSVGGHRFYTVRDCVLDHPGTAGTYIYTLTADTGCSDTTWVNNQIIGEHVVSVHLQEGAARARVIGNSWNCPETTSDLNLISVRSRGYDHAIIGNILSNATPWAIGVDLTCTGGGVIADNQLLGDQGYGIGIAVPGWLVTGNRLPNGAFFSGWAGTDSEMRHLSAWVTSSAQTVVLGFKPPNVYVKDVRIQVTQAFNSDGTDTISVGFAADHAGFAAATDVSSTGFKTPTLGGYAGYSPGNHGDIIAYYENGGTEPNQGKALVTFEYFLTAESP